MEVVYFEGTRPLFAEPGSHVMHFFEKLEALHKPNEAIKDYEDVHAFLLEISLSLEPRTRNFFDHVINDPFPGYELKAKRVTKILPGVLSTFFLQGLRYDDQLHVEW